MQLPVTLQNGNEVNRETLPPQAASSVCDSTKHNGLVTVCLAPSGKDTSTILIQTLFNLCPHHLLFGISLQI